MYFRELPFPLSQREKKNLSIPQKAILRCAAQVSTPKSSFKDPSFYIEQCYLPTLTSEVLYTAVLSFGKLGNLIYLASPKEN